MPKVMKLFGYGVYFWSNEGVPLEPIHIHVSKDLHKNATKIWILENGTVKLENNNDEIASKDLKRILKAVSVFSDEIIEKWKNNFGEISFYNDREMEGDDLER